VQFKLHTLTTSLTQRLSQSVVQQYGSAAQMLVTQFACAESQPLVNGVEAPLASQGAEGHDPADSRHVRLLHVVRTLETQIESHEVLQQNGSMAQMSTTH